MPVLEMGEIESSNRFLYIGVTTFIPYDEFAFRTAHGDGRDLWEDGTFRTNHSIIIDTVTGDVLSENKEASASYVTNPITGKEHKSPQPDTNDLTYSIKENNQGQLVVEFTLIIKLFQLCH
jgi:hypothetical protein